MKMTPKGFKFGAAKAAIKKPDRFDMGLIFCESGAAAAGAFTRNTVVAAPVVVCCERVPADLVHAVIVNSGNANACTGEQGEIDVRRLTERLAEILGVKPESVLPCSTGVIGQRLPVERMLNALPAVAADVSDDPSDFSASIMTTDRFQKMSERRLTLGGREVSVLGIAKGAGMIRPDMATMLAFIMTDAPIGVDALDDVLSRAVDESFNKITVDGDTSTNDTALALASGRAGGDPLENDPEALAQLGDAFVDVCRDLARMMVRDGEGSTKVVDFEVEGARSDEAAQKIVDAIAHSQLVKTAIFGEDPNWGRIAAAIGRSGAFDGGAFDVSIGGVEVAKGGLGLGEQAEREAKKIMQTEEYSIRVRVYEGVGKASMTASDLTFDYIKINASYRS